jgi:hypothetical protein
VRESTRTTEGEKKNEAEAAAQSSNKLSNSMKLFLESNEGYVLCPNESCGMIFEHLPPTAEEKAYMKKQQPVDDDGEPIQGDALEHYFDKRFRCRDCSTVFCSACNLVPYHLGFTCADYKNYLVAQVHPSFFPNHRSKLKYSFARTGLVVLIVLWVHMCRAALLCVQQSAAW